MTLRFPRLLCVALILGALFSGTIPAARAAQVGFRDVSPAASYAEAVQQLTSRGIIRGYADGRFGPDDALLRAQTAVTLVRAMGLSNQPVTRDFTDRGYTDAESWNAVRLLADRNVARGNVDGT